MAGVHRRFDQGGGPSERVRVGSRRGAPFPEKAENDAGEVPQTVPAEERARAVPMGGIAGRASEVEPERETEEVRAPLVEERVGRGGAGFGPREGGADVVQPELVGEIEEEAADGDAHRGDEVERIGDVVPLEAETGGRAPETVPAPVLVDGFRPKLDVEPVRRLADDMITHEHRHLQRIDLFLQVGIREGIAAARRVREAEAHLGVRAIPAGARLDEEAVEIDRERNGSEVAHAVMDAAVREVRAVERKGVDEGEGGVEAHPRAEVERPFVRLHDALRPDRSPGEPHTADEQPLLHGTLFLFTDRPAEFADRVAQGVIIPVRIGDEVGPLHVERAGLGIEVAVVGQDIDHIGYEHIMAAQREDFPHAALDGERRLFDNRRAYHFRPSRREVHLFKLPVVSPRVDATPVRGIRHVLGGEVDDKLHLPLEDGIGVPLRTHRDITHRRVGTKRTHPRDGNDIVFLRRASATHHDGG